MKILIGECERYPDFFIESVSERLRSVNTVCVEVDRRVVSRWTKACEAYEKVQLEMKAVKENVDASPSSD